MSHDDVLVGYRRRLFTLAQEIGGPPRMPGDGRPPLDLLPLEERSTAGAWRRSTCASAAGRGCQTRSAPTWSSGHRLRLGHPGFGPRRISAELAREKWGGIRISEHGVWRVLLRFNLKTRAKRLALIARHADPYERQPDPAPGAPHRRLRARREGADGLLLSSGACRAPRAPSGNTPRSTSPPASPGPSCTPQIATPEPALPASWCTASPPSSRPPAGACGGHHRQRLGVPRQAVRRGRRGARRPPPLHPRRAPQLQRLRRARPADDPRGVLAAIVRTLAGAQDHRAGSRPRRLPDDYNYDRAHTGRRPRTVPADIVYGARKMSTVR